MLCKVNCVLYNVKSISFVHLNGHKIYKILGTAPMVKYIAENALYASTV